MAAPIKHQSSDVVDAATVTCSGCLRDKPGPLPLHSQCWYQDEKRGCFTRASNGNVSMMCKYDLRNVHVTLQESRN